MDEYSGVYLTVQEGAKCNQACDAASVYSYDIHMESFLPSRLPCQHMAASGHSKQKKGSTSSAYTTSFTSVGTDHKDVAGVRRLAAAILHSHRPAQVMHLGRTPQPPLACCS